MLGQGCARGGEHRPMAGMVCGTVDRVLGADHRNAWWARTAQQPYPRTVCLSTLSAVRSPGVWRRTPSGRAASQEREAEGGAALPRPPCSACAWPALPPLGWRG
jgi:hypothetical protein